MTATTISENGIRRPMHTDAFAVTRCPVCGEHLDPTSLKGCDETGPGYVEHHRCGCGARFSVELTIESETDRYPTRCVRGPPERRPPSFDQREVSLSMDGGSKSTYFTCTSKFSAGMPSGIS